MKASVFYVLYLGCFLCFCQQQGKATSLFDWEGSQGAVLDTTPNNLNASYLNATEITSPWSEISITDGSMKPFYGIAVADGAAFPWIPVLAGVVGAGVLTYILVDEKSDDGGCDFSATAQSQSSTCELANGSVSISVSPEGTYQYLWSNGATSRNLTNVSAGVYTVTITQPGTNCLQVVSATVGNVNTPFSVSLNTSNADCGSANGSVTADVSPAGTYSFIWSNGATAESQTDLSPGTYSVTVTAEGQCIETASATIEENPPSFSISVSSTPTPCGLEEGGAEVQIEPQGTYDVLWSNGEMSESISNVSAGEYSVTVTLPGSTCAVSESVTIDEGSPEFEITSETFPSECGRATGSAKLTVTPDDNYTFEWSNSGSSAEQNDLAAGTYQVTVTLDGTTCQKEVSVTVDELPPTMQLTFDSTPAGCGINNGSAQVVVTPSGTYEYLWSNGAMQSTLTDVPSGVYVVTVTIPGSACSVTGMVEVGQTGGGFTASFTTTNADCGLTNGSALITLDPPGEYTYEWSNQQTEADLMDVESGTYSVTVLDDNACTEVFTVSIGENPVEFITIISTSPANCVTSGEISFTLTTPGAGPLVVQIEGPSGMSMFTLTPGSYMLSTLMEVQGGEYHLTVHDETTGEECQDIGTAIVIDNTPDLEANDDFFFASSGEPFSGNALDNDSGFDLQMTEAFNPFGGTVIFDASGNFTFTPDPGFSGEALFFYTVTDACGDMQTALVTILFEKVPCSFQVVFETIPASCGLEDGSITIEVLDPGEYTFEWSNGETGQTISDVEAGFYSVTVMDVNLGCDLAFDVDLQELPADYISDIIITQPVCGADGEIQFTVFTNSQNPLILSVVHPNGSDVFFIDPGVIVLSDFISITPGEYMIEVSDAGAGPNCFESFEAILIPSEQIEIFVEAVFPPTEPTSMDGVAIIGIAIPGTPPYTVLLDGNPIQVTSEEIITIEGLDVGEYIVQIIDDAGCTSNEVLVIVPFPGITLSVGTGVLFYKPDASNEQPNLLPTDYLLHNVIQVVIQYPLGSLHQEWRLTSSPWLHNTAYGEILCLTEAVKLRMKNINLKLQGGFGAGFGSHTVALERSSLASPMWSLSASADYTYKRKMKLRAITSLQGWHKIAKPVVELSAIFSLNNSK